MSAQPASRLAPAMSSRAGWSFIWPPDTLIPEIDIDARRVVFARAHAQHAVAEIRVHDAHRVLAGRQRQQLERWADPAFASIHVDRTPRLDHQLVGGDVIV